MSLCFKILGLKCFDQLVHNNSNDVKHRLLFKIFEPIMEDLLMANYGFDGDMLVVCIIDHVIWSFAKILLNLAKF